METAEILRTVGSGTSKSSTTPSSTLANCGLDNMDCPICGNTGHIIEKGPGLLEIHPKICPCMKKRLSLRSLKAAGMEDMARRYTMDSYIADTPKRKAIKDAALRYIGRDDGWFFIGGQSGSGKTHICTAICVGLMERFSSIIFMPWRDESTSLKLAMKDPDRYEKRMKALKQSPVLYIDDFLKGGTTDADIKIAFELLNARYNTKELRTIISSELPLEEIMQIDEAMGGRIYERARGFTVEAPGENWRTERNT